VSAPVPGKADGLGAFRGATAAVAVLVWAAVSIWLAGFFAHAAVILWGWGWGILE
jgi:hypothetical protein